MNYDLCIFWKFDCYFKKKLLRIKSWTKTSISYSEFKLYKWSKKTKIQNNSNSTTQDTTNNEDIIDNEKGF
jgi:hypothetical protein